MLATPIAVPDFAQIRPLLTDGDFTVFKVAAVRHLGFLKFDILTAGKLVSVKMRTAARGVTTRQLRPALQSIRSVVLNVRFIVRPSSL